MLQLPHALKLECFLFLPLHVQEQLAVSCSNLYRTWKGAKQIGRNCIFENYLHVDKVRIDHYNYRSLCSVLQRPGRRMWKRTERLSLDSKFCFLPGYTTLSAAHMFNKSCTVYHKLDYDTFNTTTFDLQVPIRDPYSETISDPLGILYYSLHDSSNLNVINSKTEKQILNIPFLAQQSQPSRIRVDFDNCNILATDETTEYVYFYNIEATTPQKFGKHIDNYTWNTQHTFLGYPYWSTFSFLSLYDIRRKCEPISIWCLQKEGEDEETYNPSYYVNDHYVCVQQSCSKIGFCSFTALDIRMRGKSLLFSEKLSEPAYKPQLIPPFFLFQNSCEVGDKMLSMRIVDIFTGQTLQQAFLMPDEKWRWMRCVKVHNQWGIIVRYGEELLFFKDI